jgi:uncharacterized membrane protein YcaP (DUF421 family)
MDGMNEILHLVLLSVGAVLYLFIISKIIGKKQLAQLDMIDYVSGITIGSIAAEMMTDTSDKPFYYYLIAMTVCFLLNLFIIFLERKGMAMKRLLNGKANIVINDGKIDYAELKKSKFDVNDIITMARLKGFFNLSDIAYAVLENNGQLSILPKAENVPVVASDINVEKPSSVLPSYLVVDGKVLTEELESIGKDESWLFEQLGIDSEEDVGNVFIASYYAPTDEMNVHYKNG